jgi:hypothetical protein
MGNSKAKIWKNGMPNTIKMGVPKNKTPTPNNDCTTTTKPMTKANRMGDIVKTEGRLNSSMGVFRESYSATNLILASVK